MSAYAKTAAGETLRYQPSNLDRWAGEPFCLRITVEDMALERCFFLYLDEGQQYESIRSILQQYFVAPKPDRVEEVQTLMEKWLKVDPMLPKKYMLLQQLITRFHQGAGQMFVYVNHGPGPLRLEETVESHLGTSVFADGSFNDKILDLVLEFHSDDDALMELQQWDQFAFTDTTGVTGPTRFVKRRKISQAIFVLIMLLTMPFLFFSCQDKNNGNGFGGGML